jgi:hypothetical protein
MKFKKILKTEKLFSKIVMVIFLVMIVLGFTVPGFIGNQDQTSNTAQVEPRLCRSDAECYLNCEEGAVPVICLQNLCIQNECGYSYYDYNKNNLISFKLDVTVDVGSINNSNVTVIELSQRSDSQNFFITFNEDSVSLFSSKLSLNHVFDKVNLAMNEECLQVGKELYCTNDNYFLSMHVNGNESSEYGNYLPQNDDEVSISYLLREPFD